MKKNDKIKLLRKEVEELRQTILDLMERIEKLSTKTTKPILDDSKESMWLPFTIPNKTTYVGPPLRDGDPIYIGHPLWIGPSISASRTADTIINTNQKINDAAQGCLTQSSLPPPLPA